MIVICNTKNLCVCVCSGGGRGGDINPELILSFIFFVAKLDTVRFKDVGRLFVVC